MKKLTISYNKAESNRKWYLVDLQGKVLGRAASKIAMILRGKETPQFTAHDDVGGFIVVINAKGVKLTGNKLKDKIYYHHSGYIGGLKEYTAEKLLEKKPQEMIFRAVRGMMPKTYLAKKQLKKLKIYPGSEHPHIAQKPEVLDL
jgi:large subunit ribosomal protein L13